MKLLDQEWGGWMGEERGVLPRDQPPIFSKYEKLSFSFKVE